MAEISVLPNISASKKIISKFCSTTSSITTTLLNPNSTFKEITFALNQVDACRDFLMELLSTFTASIINTSETSSHAAIGKALNDAFIHGSSIAFNVSPVPDSDVCVAEQTKNTIVSKNLRSLSITTAKFQCLLDDVNEFMKKPVPVMDKSKPTNNHTVRRNNQSIDEIRKNIQCNNVYKRNGCSKHRTGSCPYGGHTDTEVSIATVSPVSATVASNLNPNAVDFMPSSGQKPICIGCIQKNGCDKKDQRYFHINN